jgi:hypothetical protein
MLVFCLIHVDFLTLEKQVKASGIREARTLLQKKVNPRLGRYKEGPEGHIHTCALSFYSPRPKLLFVLFTKPSSCSMLLQYFVYPCSKAFIMLFYGSFTNVCPLENQNSSGKDFCLICSRKLRIQHIQFLLNE